MGFCWSRLLIARDGERLNFASLHGEMVARRPSHSTRYVEFERIFGVHVFFSFSFILFFKNRNRDLGNQLHG